MNNTGRRAVTNERTRLWREAKRKKEEAAKQGVEEQKKRELVFMGGKDTLNLDSPAWAIVFTSMGFCRELVHCATVCKQWNGVIDGDAGVLCRLHNLVLGSGKPEYLSWTRVYASFPGLIQTLTTLDLPRAKLEAFIWRTEWLRKGIKHDTKSVLMKIVLEWSIIYGHETIVQSILGEEPPVDELVNYMSRYALSAGHKPPIVRCLANGHVKWLFSKTLPDISPDDMSALSLFLLACSRSEENIYNTLALLPKIYTQKLTFNALLKGRMDVVNAIEDKVNNGEKIWKEKSESDLKFYDLPADASVFTFTEQESAELFIKYLEKESAKKSEDAALLASLKSLSITSPEKRPGETQKLREMVFTWLIQHGVVNTLPVGRVIPAIGEYSSYTTLFDCFKDKVPNAFAYNLCSNAQKQVDHDLFEYLLENHKVDKDVVDSEGNGLVYTAFVGANIAALRILAKYKANPNLFSLISSGTTLFDLCLHSQKYKDTKAAVDLLLRFPDVQLPSPEFLLLVDEPTVRALIKAGVSTDYTNATGLNLVQRALMIHAHPSVIRLLIDAGAKLDVPFEAPEEVAREENDDEEEGEEERKVERFPPIAIAFYYEQLGLVQYMLEKGVDPTPSLVALATLNNDLVDEFSELLEELGVEKKDQPKKEDKPQQEQASFDTVSTTELTTGTLKFTYDNDIEEKTAEKSGFAFEFDGL